MAKHSKRFRWRVRDRRPRPSPTPVAEAAKLLKKNATAKFDETIEIAMNLGIDPKQSDQTVRGAVTLPGGTGKAVRVAVFAKDAKAKEALAAGADIVGAQDLAEKVEKGEINFDRVIATPDMMAVVGKLGKVLGPRGLMPNPKLGTVTPNVTEAVRARQGRPGPVPGRQGRRRARRHRQGQLQREGDRGQHPRLLHGDQRRQAAGLEGNLYQEGQREFDHGARAPDRPRRPGRSCRPALNGIRCRAPARSGALTRSGERPRGPIRSGPVRDCR